MNRFQRAYACGAEDMRSRSAMRERAMMAQAQENTTPHNTCPDLALAMAYVKNQTFQNLYEAEDGWHRGTIFADLDKPYEGGCRTC